ncbi:hypothetical protein HYX14_03325, partial [Candidatus Woesearchaeota archaeon]|nr:hypothetical protein [Candidatus Woesearchaeota archaeon]
IPRQIKIQFTTLGEAVKEQEFKVEKKAFSGTAIDLDTEQNTMDMYAIFVPEELTQKLEQAYAGGGITGAAVVQPAEQGEYLLELSLDKKETPKPKERRFPFRFLMLPSGESAFADLYGPYKLKEGQSFIFAQQFKYDPKVYTGEYEIKTKIYRDNNVLVENEFPVMLGAELPPEQQVPLVLPQPVEEALSLLKRSYQILGLWIVPAVLIFLGILVGGFVFIRRH